MDQAPSSDVPNDAASPGGDKLDSWKEIAGYLNRSVRTVHRWEKHEGLPVHRHRHRELGSVFAYKSELDAWFETRSPQPQSGVENIDQGAAARRRLTFAVVGAAAALCVVAVSYLMLRGSDPATSVANLELISTFEGSHRWPSFSPDGRTIAFVSDAGGTPQVWVKNLDGGDAIQLTSGELPASRPRWSPQGDRIIYSVRGSGIWSVTPLSGEPRRVVEDGWNGELSPDGRRLVFERAGQILVANADGSDVVPLSGLPRRLMPYMGDAWPSFSPDGRSIAAFLGEAGRYGDYWIVPLTGGESFQHTTDIEEGGAPAWTPDGDFLVLPAPRRGRKNMLRVSTYGG